MMDPFESLLNLQRALDTARRSDWLSASTSGRGAYPPINVFRQGESDFMVIVELPGIDRESLNVEVKDNAIRVKGQKAIEYGADVSVHRRERSQGAFDRTVSIPVDVDAARVKAEYRDGVLAIQVPQAEAAKPRSVAIN